MTTLTEIIFVAATIQIADKAHKIAVDHGWWDEALVAKVRYNEGREYRHGGKRL